jgi:16S rRNA (guanine966-N2)-methyltransferase
VIKKATPARLPQTLRIIGGEWRGRKLSFPALPGLRPTPDRVRETLFNWLAPIIHGAHCLDLFAGSGALGLEALSRGAADVVMVDEARAVIQQLRAHIALLKTTQATLYQLSIPSALPTPAHPFDIVFLDPPFHKNLLAPCCDWLEAQTWLAPNATIYLEAEADLKTLSLPNNLKLLHDKRAGQVRYCLAERIP